MQRISAKYLRYASQVYWHSNVKESKSFEILDIKNSHILQVEDKLSQLPYMSQVITDNGQKGIVLKLQQQKKTIIGMYHNLQSNQAGINKININSINPLVLPKNFIPDFNHIYDINLDVVAQVKDIQKNRKKSSQFAKQNKRIRIKSLSPLLTLSHDIFVGDFVAFSGPLGSGRTTNALDIVQCFTNSSLQQTIGIYLNTNNNDFKDCINSVNKYHTLCFGRSANELVNSKVMQKATGLKRKNRLSSVGVYMLAVKCIQTAIKLKKQNKNVILVIDNINEILANQWTILQNLKLPISPFSILNQIYSNSSDNNIKKSHRSNKIQKQSTKLGSLTTIVVNSNQQQDVVQQYSRLGNNTKYLRTLCPHIQFPLKPLINNNKIIQNKLLSSMRRKVNWLLKEKKQKQLLIKLKLSKDQPWENYFILDSQWWIHALNNYKPESLGDRDLFLWFINRNIEEDYCAHWRITCIQAYNKYLDYLARPQQYSIGKQDQQLENFIQLCKAERYFDIFKKDYLN